LESAGSIAVAEMLADLVSIIGAVQHQDCGSLTLSVAAAIVEVTVGMSMAPIDKSHVIVHEKKNTFTEFDVHPGAPYQGEYIIRGLAGYTLSATNCTSKSQPQF
jgi:hypothetical protein